MVIMPIDESLLLKVLRILQRVVELDAFIVWRDHTIELEDLCFRLLAFTFSNR